MPNHFEYDRIQEYMHSLVPPRPPEMQAMEAYAAMNDFPIIGPVAGYYCYQLASLTNALTVFEMGSGYGYSTAWFAKAVRENSRKAPDRPARVHHVVWDAQLSDLARGHLQNLGFEDLVEYHVTEAVAALRDMPGEYDLIFCDIEKEDYPAALPVIEKKLRPGGMLIIDNMLWYARIFDPSDVSPSTNGVREFTRQICASPDWTVSLAPLRDGMIVAHKSQHGWNTGS